MSNRHIIIGVDEVGRGPWAGPLVVGAVALDMDKDYQGLVDSKKLSPKKRMVASNYIKEVAVGIGLGWVDAAILDNIGLTSSLKLATSRAFDQLSDIVKKEAETIVVDGNIQMLDDPRSVTLIKADDKVQAVSAASIVAKVARDSYMAELDKVFPGYDFQSNSGYGTKKHQEALSKNGIIDGVHRKSFAPIKKMLGDDCPNRRRIDSTTGRLAENVAVDYLLSNRYKIINRNYRCKFFEIDIVAKKGGALYFVEVKYRSNNDYGDGLSAITGKKLDQMRFAANMFLSANNHYENLDPYLMAISLTGAPPEVADLVVINN